PVARQIFDYYMGNIEDIRRPVSLPVQLGGEEEELGNTDEIVPDDSPEPVTEAETTSDVQP
ncbi:MAG TPA: hypothetical protein PL020_07660, partial [Candidatus Cloacimonadota bacterium]|nr:hypothetical protein [Candidatus Cloacimonadota bacterium]